MRRNPRFQLNHAGMAGEARATRCDVMTRVDNGEAVTYHPIDASGRTSAEVTSRDHPSPAGPSVTAATVAWPMSMMTRFAATAAEAVTRMTGARRRAEVMSGRVTHRDLLPERRASRRSLTSKRYALGILKDSFSPSQLGVGVSGG